MQSYKKVSKNEAEVINYDNKEIKVFGMPTKILSVSYMTLSGRHPDKGKVQLEKDCSFVMYVTKGPGRYIINGDTVEVDEGDSVFVRSGSTFVAEGHFEYVCVNVPAFYPEAVDEIPEI